MSDNELIPPRVCPCCGATVTRRRTTRLTDAQCAHGYLRCVVHRGYTRERLLAEEAETLDLIAPGMVDWLRALSPEQT
jgi:hypothetical protein